MTGLVPLHDAVDIDRDSAMCGVSSWWMWHIAHSDLNGMLGDAQRALTVLRNCDWPCHRAAWAQLDAHTRITAVQTVRRGRRETLRRRAAVVLTDAVTRVMQTQLCLSIML